VSSRPVLAAAAGLLPRSSPKQQRTGPAAAPSCHHAASEDSSHLGEHAATEGGGECADQADNEQDPAHSISPRGTARLRSPAVHTIRQPLGTHPGSAGRGAHSGHKASRTPLSARRSAPTPVASQVLTADLPH